MHVLYKLKLKYGIFTSLNITRRKNSFQTDNVFGRKVDRNESLTSERSFFFVIHRYELLFPHSFSCPGNKHLCIILSQMYNVILYYTYVSVYTYTCTLVYVSYYSCARERRLRERNAICISHNRFLIN